MKWNESLKAIRKERKKTQKEIATELQVSQALVSAWELGVNKPDIDNLFKLREPIPQILKVTTALPSIQKTRNAL